MFKNNMIVVVLLLILESVWGSIEFNHANANANECDDLVSFLPPRTSPAIVMQVVNKKYIEYQTNFINVMEMNSQFTKDNLFLMCLDDESFSTFTSFGINCVNLENITEGLSNEGEKRHKIWETRVEYVSCLVRAGHDVIMSDSDALWLRDPMEIFDSHMDSSIIASRGIFPPRAKREWGTAMCMGFIFFRSTGTVMNTFQKLMKHFVDEFHDDQIALNEAALEMGVVWNKGSDMKYEGSTGFATGIIDLKNNTSLVSSFIEKDDDLSETMEVTLIPHDIATRWCIGVPISEKTVIAHCGWRGQDKSADMWMKEANVWFP